MLRLDDLEYMNTGLLGFKTDGQAKGETFRIWKSLNENYVCKSVVQVHATHWYNVNSKINNPFLCGFLDM